MKVLKPSIVWHSEQPDNPPELQLLVEEFPQMDDLKYHQNGDTFYAKSKEGVLRFYHYTGPGKGDDGNDVTIQLLGGKKKTLHGPWSSRTSIINAMNIGQYMDVTCIRKSDRRRRVVTMALKKVLPYIVKLNATFKQSILEKSTGEVLYIPWLPKKVEKNLKLTTVSI